MADTTPLRTAMITGASFSIGAMYDDRLARQDAYAPRVPSAGELRPRPDYWLIGLRDIGFVPPDRRHLRTIAILHL